MYPGIPGFHGNIKVSRYTKYPGISGFQVNQISRNVKVSRYTKYPVSWKNNAFKKGVSMHETENY